LLINLKVVIHDRHVDGVHRTTYSITLHTFEILSVSYFHLLPKHVQTSAIHSC